MTSEILIVDDEADIRNLIRGILEDEGYKTRLAGSARETYAEMEKRKPDLLILDIWLQGSAQDGMGILETIKSAEHTADIPVVMISGHGTIETAVSAIKKGAYDFIEKPFKSGRLILMIQRALETAALRRENTALKKKTRESNDLLGTSQAIQSVRQMIEKAAVTNSRVFLTGEPGTGKDVAARMLYKLSGRAGRPFVIMNCAALESEKFERRLFGEGQEPGLLQEAHTGTLFLDEVSDMPLETQGKIVRVMQEQRFRKDGDRDFTPVDVRILSASNRDMGEEIKAGRFREDLFYRLNVVPVHIPPLRGRTGDIPALAAHFMAVFCEDSGIMNPPEFSTGALAALKEYIWPGNVRQLRNVVEWIMIMRGGKDTNMVEVSDMPPEIGGAPPMKSQSNFNGETAPPPASVFMDMPLREAREAFERAYLKTQISRFDGNVSKTADFIGMERSALHRKLKSLDVETLKTSSNLSEMDTTKHKRA